MSNRIVTLAVLLTAAAAVLDGQAPGHSLKTPWGEPDLQGLWTSQPEWGVPFERSKEYGERQTLTDAEFAARQAQAAKQLAADNAGVLSSGTFLPSHWLERGQPSRRTSLVIDPADGRVPALSAEAQARQRQRGRGSFGSGPFNSHEDFTLEDRCITRGVPTAIYSVGHSANTRVVQGPAYVAISYEMIHETRVVPIDGRPPLPAPLRQYLGDARGHWEGDTLVIRTANFNGRASFRGASDTLVLTERFRRLDADTLRYEMTLEDPGTWARPWTAALNLKPQPDQMYEYACHEGNHALRNMLSAARAADRK
jgi:hypothetical protein